MRGSSFDAYDDSDDMGFDPGDNLCDIGVAAGNVEAEGGQFLLSSFHAGRFSSIMASISSSS